MQRFSRLSSFLKILLISAWIHFCFKNMEWHKYLIFMGFNYFKLHLKNSNIHELRRIFDIFNMKLLQFKKCLASCQPLQQVVKTNGHYWIWRARGYNWEWEWECLNDAKRSQGSFALLPFPLIAFNTHIELCKIQSTAVLQFSSFQ